MARAKSSTTEPEPIEANHTQAANDQAALYQRMERGVAIRLYEVWVTAGQLTGDKWTWANQSTRSQGAWLSVARAVMGPAFQFQFGPREIAELLHG